MSSAALQTAPQPPSSVSSHSPVVNTASPSTRSYNGAASQSRTESQYNQHATNASPSTTQRRPSRRPSGNGAPSNTNSQQAQQYPQGAPNQVPAALVAPRGSSSSQSSPVVPASAAYPQMAPGDPQRGVPPVVSQRTSSSRNNSVGGQGTGSTGERASSRRREYNDASHPPQDGSDGQQYRESRQRSNGNVHTNGADRDANYDDPARARRRTQQASAESPSTREPRTSRSASAVPRSSQATSSTSQVPTGPSKESSDVLNRVIYSKPEEDAERERERARLAEPTSTVIAQKTHNTGNMTPASDATPDASRSGGRNRNEQTPASSSKSKNVKFGEYYLGNTLGEGEFGKVKMGWKQEGSQVAIKFIRRDNVANNPSRLAKIYREIAILQEISHPNIVRLHEMVETERQIGIILEYASGGELFDYILNHRYLKDNAARRLFAQLISGVGYLHKKGIVHRDLKLENLLLDHNRNIIITDFGFANTFNPDDELGEEIEYNLASRDYVEKMGLGKILPDGYRRGDLMQTSCGSPCYAAPELVVSDSLYTGRKVDVWSCGVILYAMLAGYLPFDDDPANPEGDNINLLYKYIVNTPLTFPEYVTPHARDLLRRILVPDPRKRADLFEVARHSWLSEYSHEVGFITSTTTTRRDIPGADVSSDDVRDTTLLGRSASVREPSKPQKSQPTIGDLSRKHGNVDQDGVEQQQQQKTQKDNKRRTVQVEYVAPRSQTQRGEPTATPQQAPRSRARPEAQGPVEVPGNQNNSKRPAGTEKPLPQDPPTSLDPQYASQARQGSSSQRQQGSQPTTRPVREPPRAVSDTNYMTAPPQPPIARPNTGGSMTSNVSRSGSMGLPTRGSYSQPVAPTVAGTNAHGHMSQPKIAKPYISNPIIADVDESEFGRPSVSQGQVPAKFAKLAGPPGGPIATESKGHKRSKTSGSIFSRTNSIFGGKSKADRPPERHQEKLKKSYPPVSMNAGVAGDEPRASMDSRRSISFGFSKKRSGSVSGSNTTTQEKSKRFSLLPASLSLKSIGIGKDYEATSYSEQQIAFPRTDSRGNPMEPPQGARDLRQGSLGNVNHHYQGDNVSEGYRGSPVLEPGVTSSSSLPQHQRFASQGNAPDMRSGGQQQFLAPITSHAEESGVPTESETSLNQGPGAYAQANQYPDLRQPAGRSEPANLNNYDDNRGPAGRGNGRGVLQKNNRKFADAYEQEHGNSFAPHSDHAGSSGAARKVMDFFRRRGKARGDDR